MLWFDFWLIYLFADGQLRSCALLVKASGFRRVTHLAIFTLFIYKIVTKIT